MRNGRRWRKENREERAKQGEDGQMKLECRESAMGVCCM